MSNLFGRAKDVCRHVKDEVLLLENGTQLVVGAVYKSNSLSVLAHIFDKLQKLLPTLRADSASFKNYEPRFNVQLCKFNALSEAVRLSNATAALYIQANANADSAQQLSIFAAAASSDSALSFRSPLNDFVKTGGYETVDFFLRQCSEKMFEQASAAEKSTCYKH